MPKKSEVETDSADLPGVAAVSRALSILCSFGAEDSGLGLAEISRRTGLYKSTVLRLVESLESYGFMTRTKGGDFRLGVELVRLGALARRSVGGAEDIIAILDELMQQTGESATYYVRRGNQRLALYRVDSSKSVRDHIRAGDLLPLKFGAAGRVLNSASTRRRPSDDAKAFPPIVSLGERDAEVAAVAGPVYSGDALVGALSISGPISRFTPANVAAMSKLLQTQCRALSDLLGEDGA